MQEQRMVGSDKSVVGGPSPRLLLAVLLGTLLAASLALSSCGLEVTGTKPPPSGPTGEGGQTTTNPFGGTSSSAGGNGSGLTGGGATGGAGGAQPCDQPDQCPGVDTTCRYRTCESHLCGFANAVKDTPCTEDDGDFCDGNGACVKADGKGCSLGTECLSGFCVDGVCCNSACDSTCEGCAVAGSVGTCSPQPAGTDPDNDCTPNGVCDGSRACASGTPDWGWAAGVGDNQRAWGVAVDSADNVILTGYFEADLNLGCSTLQSTGAADIFVAKFSSAGTCLWSKRFGEPAMFDDEQRAYRVAVDSSNNIIITGFFEGDVDFGAASISSAGYYDVFVAKFDSSGTNLWAKSFAGGYSDYAHSVAVDPQDNILVAGYFRSTTLSIDGAVLSNEGFIGETDVFLVKLDSAGAHVWSSRFGDAGDQCEPGYLCAAVTADTTGDYYLAGGFDGAMDFGNGVLPEGGAADIYLVKFDTTGTLEWEKTFGGAEDQVAYGATTDGANNVIITGGIEGDVDFGGGTLSAGGGSVWDVYVASFSAAGTHDWSERFGANDADNQYGMAVTVDGSNNIVLAGNFRGSMVMGGTTHTSVDEYDFFVAKFATDKTLLWSQSLGGTDRQVATDTIVDSTGRSIVSGYFAHQFDFAGSPLTNAGDDDLFLLTFYP